MSEVNHWLVNVVQRGGKSLSQGLDLPGFLPVPEAWARVRDACRISDRELVELVARHFHLGRANFAGLDHKALKLVPESVAREYLVFPLREDYRRLVLATSDPTNLNAEQAVGFASGRGVSMEIASPGELEEALMAHYSPDRAVNQILSQIQPDMGESIRLIEEEHEPASSAALLEAGAGPVVDLTNVLLREAVISGASDIHLQPTQHGGIVRYRVDGVLRTTGQMPLPVLSRVVSRIKIMGRLDIADRLRPQDGRAKVAIGNRTVELRISTVPTRSSEKAVIRILDPQQSRKLEEIGLLEPELSRFRALLTHREGVVVVTGPTGSGKTTTLYAALQHIHNEDINIMTVEDPVEYEVPGLTQIQVEPKQGMTFGSALRAILRQDPDVLFVGEIRDGETAQICAQASQTGHLVLSTLHTNDALGTLGRLLDLGVKPPVLAETLRGALAQRLVRTLCRECSVKVEGGMTAEESRLAEAYGVRPQVRAVGCERCGHSGYRGRVPLMEVVALTPRLQKLVAEGADAQELHRCARAEGVRFLREVGIARVAAGETTLQELERVLGDTGEEGGATDAEAPTEESVAAVVAVGSGAPREAGAPVEDGPAGVLLVDDDGANRTIARALLESEGYAVKEARDGVEALEAVRGGRLFSLVILDLDMPRMGGREVLKELRGNLATVGLPVIVLTGTTDPESEFEVMELGADDYIRKPFDPRRFLTRVKATLRRAGG